MTVIKGVVQIVHCRRPWIEDTHNILNQNFSRPSALFYAFLYIRSYASCYKYTKPEKKKRILQIIVVVIFKQEP